jgi:hypothetical protein
VDWNSQSTYDTYVYDEDLIEVEENFIFKEEEIIDHFWEIYMPHVGLLREQAAHKRVWAQLEY